MIPFKETPNNRLPLLPPPAERLENIDILRKLAEARAALAELKGRAPVIPDQKMLINTIALQEARDSSSIENIFTTSDRLYRAFSASSVPDNQTKEVLRYRQALYQAWTEFDQYGFSIGLIEKINRTIIEKSEGLREKEVYIGDRSTIIYTPPAGKEIILAKLENWLDFALGDYPLDPLIKMALLHYQFEAIHPFSDGNGRTGRVLNVLFLCNQQLLDQPILYLSKYINENKSDYYRLLRQVTERENWEEWILFMLEAVRSTAIFTLDKVNAIYGLFRETLEKVKTRAPKIYSYELVKLLFLQPYCKIAFLTESGIASRNTASKYLGELEDAGILIRESAGNEILYLNHELLKVIRDNPV